MQKGELAKLKLLLSGIAARLDKNRDFFVQADCTFTSGKKKFPRSADAHRAGVSAAFPGQQPCGGRCRILCVFYHAGGKV